MKRLKKKSQLLMIALVVGFLFGIIYENIAIKNTGITMDAFQRFYLEKYEKTKVISEDFLWYVVKMRCSVFAILVLVGCLKWKKVGAILWCGWTGFLFGTMIVSSIIQLGVKGLFVSIVGMFPHMLFYVPACAILLIFIYEFPKKQWNWSKTFFVMLTVFIGIVLECYVNPPIMKMIIKIV